MVAFAPRGGHDLLAGVALWTGVREIAGATTERESIWVHDAGARGGGRAIPRVGAGEAEIREIGGADVLAIAAVRDQSTGPSVGAVCVTGLGADVLAHMVRADARVTVVGGIAGLTEAARSRFAGGRVLACRCVFRSSGLGYARAVGCPGVGGVYARDVHREPAVGDVA